MDKNRYLFFILISFSLLFVSLFSPPTSNQLLLRVSAAQGEDKEEEKPDIIIRNNKLQDSGSGIYVRPREDRILFQGNEIIKNGEGIRLVGTTGYNWIKNNQFLSNVVGIKVQDTYSHNEKGLIKYPEMAPEKIEIEGNEIIGSDYYGLLNLTRHPLQTGGNFWSWRGPILESPGVRRRDFSPSSLGLSQYLTGKTELSNAEMRLRVRLGQPLLLKEGFGEGDSESSAFNRLERFSDLWNGSAFEVSAEVLNFKENLAGSND